MTFEKDKFITKLKEMKVSELNELVKAIEEEFSVTASVPIVATNGSTADDDSAEKNLVLKSMGANKVAVIKIVREVMGLGLMEAKTFTENGGIIKEDVSTEEAEELISKFKEAGADVATE